MRWENSLSERHSSAVYQTLTHYTLLLFRLSTFAFHLVVAFSRYRTHSCYFLSSQMIQTSLSSCLFLRSTLSTNTADLILSAHFIFTRNYWASTDQSPLQYLFVYLLNSKKVWCALLKSNNNNN